MTGSTTHNQSRIYLYDLMNTAKEFGFKKDDNWELNMVSFSERVHIERNFHPVISMKTLPETLLQIFNQVKTGLNQSLTKSEGQLDTAGIHNGEMRYIVAHNPKRPR